MSATPTATDPSHCGTTATHPLTPSKAASLILGTDLYPLYVNWQINIDDPEQAALYPSRTAWRRTVQAMQEEEIGGIPSSQSFKAFMSTSRVKQQLYTRTEEKSHVGLDGSDDEKEGTPDLLITRLCKHPIHPGNPCEIIEVCPVCLMTQCLASLDRIAHVWRLVGGPYKPCRSEITGVRWTDPEETSIYYAAKRLWHAEKARWANLAHIYGQYAKGEELWEEDSRQNGFAIPVSVQTSSSCMDALELAMQSPFVVEGWGEAFVPEKYLVRRGTGDELRGSSVAREEGKELPYSPPETPETELETLRDFNEGAGGIEVPDDHTSRHNNDVHSISSTSDDTPSTSPDPSPPPPPPSSPPQTPPSVFSPFPPITVVSFPNDLPPPSYRRPAHFQRTSSSYKQGKHASPPGSTWADTSFMSDSKYDNFRVEEDEDEEADRLMKAWDESFDGAGGVGELGPAGVTDGDVGEDDEANGSESSNDSDDDSDSDDGRVHAPRRTASVKRLPGQASERPVFSFIWRQQPEPNQPNEPDVDATADDFDDEEAEQAIQAMHSQNADGHIAPTTNTDMSPTITNGTEGVNAIPRVESSQVSPRRRSHDVFVEPDAVDEGDAVKRHCH